MSDFNIITSWIHQTLTSIMPEGLTVFIECAVIGVCIVALYTMLATLLIYMECKMCGFFQCRLGPSRVGKQGDIQVLCDVPETMTKEIIELKHSDKFLYNPAPFMVTIVSFLAFSCLPINKGLEVLDFNVGVFLLLAASSIDVVDILLAGWGSNNKFSLIDAIRSGAQIISYKLSAGPSVLMMVVLMGTAQFFEIVESQANGWLIFKGHIPTVIAFIIYLITENVECNRGPFDLPETESELTAGHHTEYSGTHLGFFCLTEYLNMLIITIVAAITFLGGWMPLHIIGLDGFNAVMDYIPDFIWSFDEAFFMVFLLMWIKWTFPRLRIDQILNPEWRYLVPISMTSLVIMMLIIVLGLHFQPRGLRNEE